MTNKKYADIKCIAFDLDGTLLDSLPDIHYAINLMLADLKKKKVSISITKNLIGLGFDYLLSNLIDNRAGVEDTDFDYAKHLFERYYFLNLTTNSKLFPNVTKLLKELKVRGIKVACITNKPKKFTLPILKNFELISFFDSIISGDSYVLKKPSPYPLMKCATELKISNKSMLMVGDSVTDVNAAKKAEIPVICVDYGYRGKMAASELECDILIDDIYKILNYI